MPPDGWFLWRAFWELEATRSVGAGGLCPIAFAEIEAWARLTAVELAPYEVEILRRMDRERLKTAAKRKG